jgi:hypothetical protein
MSDRIRNHQAICAECWQGTVWERLEGTAWIQIGDRADETLIIISAWNPAGRLLPISVNQARDAVLLAELTEMGLSPRRVRGRSPDHAWSEECWQIAHAAGRSNRLLRRYGQIAGWITAPMGARYCWAEPHPAI